MTPITLTYRNPENLPVLSLPLSKSVASRLMIISLLAGGDPGSIIKDKGSLCDDLEIMLDALTTLRHLMGKEGGKAIINIHNSGTAKRFLTTLCASLPGITTTLRMDERLSERPMENLPYLLRLLTTGKEISGARTSVTIKGGKFVGLDMPIRARASRSSQTCSSIMLVAPTGDVPTRLTLSTDTVSRSYIEMTAKLMRECGVNVKYEEPWTEFKVYPSKYNVPSPSLLEYDWSAAGFFYLYSVLSGEKIILKGLTPPHKSVQGDSHLVEIFRRLGVNTVFDNDCTSIIAGEHYVDELQISLRDVPDLAPVVIIACAMKRIPFIISGISHLRYKESDRITALVNGLALYGVHVDYTDDILSWNGAETPHAPEAPVKVYNDHRIAMAFAMTAVRFPSVTIEDIECSGKSFPTFREQLPALGLFEV